MSQETPSITRERHSDERLFKVFPFVSNYITIAGHRMHYIDEGTGPVVLLLHGNPTWSFYYRNLINTLKSKFRVIAPDFIGLGLSDHPINAHFRASHRIAHLQEFIEHLGLTKYSLVMHDWGGSIGTGVAVRNPSAIEGLVFLNTTLTETESLPFIIKRAARPLVGKFLTKTTKHFVKLTTDWGVSRKMVPDVKYGYHLPYGTSARRTAIWDFVADIPFDSDHPSYDDMLFLAENIPKLAHVPTLIVWGLQDPCFHREMLSQVARHFPHAEVIEIPHGSHLVLEDAPDITNPAILNFLSGKPTGSDPSGAVYGKDIIRGRHPLYNSFLAQVEKQPSADAIVVPLFVGRDVQYRHTNYRDLATLINKYQRGLSKLGLVAGDKVLMLVVPGVDFLALSYAVMARGAVPVYLDSGMGTQNLLKCIEEVAPQVFIGSLKAQLLRLKRKDLFKRVKFSLTASRWSFIRGRDLSFLQRFSSGALPAAPVSDTALIAFTSGATGAPKGVVYTPKMVEAQLSIFRDVFEMKPGVKDVPLLPIFSLFNLANGVGSVFPPVNPSKPLSLEPWKIIKIIKDLSVQYSFGSPTLWGKIAEYAVRSRESLPTLKKVFMAGAPVASEISQRVKDIIPNGEAYTPYGATEALPVTLASTAEIGNVAVSTATGGEQGTVVGKPVSGVSIKIIKQVDAPLEDISKTAEVGPNEIGEIIVSGDNVSPGYYLRPETTQLSKIKDGSKFWHRMGDVGYLDKSGTLFFCGRKVHRVLTDSRVYYSVPTERLFNVHPKVRRSALVTLDKGRGPAIVVEPQPQHWPGNKEEREKFIAELRELGTRSPITSNLRHFFFHKSFPVDARHNAKIFRDVLGTWASGRQE